MKVYFLIIFLFLSGCMNSISFFPKEKKIKDNVKKKKIVKKDNSIYRKDEIKFISKKDKNNTILVSSLSYKKEFNSSKKIVLNKLIQKILALKGAEVKKINYKNRLILLISLGPVVHFDTDKYDIKNKYKQQLKKIVYILKDSNKSVLIVGHTDSVGSDRYNQALSELRAREVYKFFIKNGFNKEMLDYIGYGEEQPLATNATEEGRAKNRRVELFVDGNTTFMMNYLKNREINTSFLNNHNKLQAGYVEKTIKGWSKNLSELKIKEKFLKLSKPSREELKINLKPRVLKINFPKRELKERE